jgi:CRISPR-associated protein Cas1
MKVVIVEKPEVTLAIKKQQLYVGEQGIPLRLVEILVLRHDVNVSSRLLLKLSREHIAVLFISKNNQDFALTMPQVSKNSEIKAAQYRALNNRLGLAKYFVDEKIARHIDHLKSLSIIIDREPWQENVRKAESIDALMGVEGSFTRHYFSHYFKFFAPALQKGKRSKRPALDPVNAILSYLYSIIYNLLTAKLYIAGFEPSISYLHTPFRSHYALSSDLMELFRARINEKVLEWFDDRLLAAEDFKMKKGIYLKYESRKKLWQSIKLLMDEISLEADKEISLIRSAIS